MMSSLIGASLTSAPLALCMIALPPAANAKTGCGYFSNVTLGPTQGSWSSNCHRYQYVEAPGISWERANSIASLMQLGGVNGYLATLTSQDELTFAESVIPGGVGDGKRLHRWCASLEHDGDLAVGCRPEG